MPAQSLLQYNVFIFLQISRNDDRADKVSRRGVCCNLRGQESHRLRFSVAVFPNQLGIFQENVMARIHKGGFIWNRGF